MQLAERPILSSSKGQGLASSNSSRNSAAPTVITRSNNPYSYSKQENSKQDILTSSHEDLECYQKKF